MARDSYLSRESILKGSIRKYAESRPGIVRLMPDDERIAWVQKMIKSAPSPDQIWVYGYGSLIWNPAFHYAERVRGRVHGYHRSFCLWSKLGRGCEDNPGLMLGLEPGGSSTGVAYRVDADKAETELDILFRRELMSYAYIPTWVTFETSEARFRAMTFVMDRNHERYASGVDESTAIRHLSTAVGPLGRNCDYLFDLVDNLRELAFRDRRLEKLARDVREFQKAHGIQYPPVSP